MRNGSFEAISRVVRCLVCVLQLRFWHVRLVFSLDDGHGAIVM